MTKSCWSVYEHISPSGKIYVGITSKKCSSRWGNSGKRYLTRQSNGDYSHRYFAPAILKYGWDNFQHIIIATSLKEEEAKALEIKLMEEMEDLEPLLLIKKKVKKLYHFTIEDFSQLLLEIK